MNDTIQTARTVNRKHKDTLFRYIFADKKALLSLYNALNGTDYTDENELEEYAFFIHLLRGYVAEGHPFPTAAQMAVNECIERNILHEILSKNRAEVYNMMLYEYDEAKHYESLRREGERRSGQKWQMVLAEKDTHISALDADNRRLREELAVALGANT